MALYPLPVPPGIFRRGTEYQSKGRAYDANLVRWYGLSPGPIGGWRNRGLSTVTGKARRVISWKTSSEVRWSGVGTHSKLYAVSSSPAYFDITPTDFVAGTADATAKTGYGYGAYGAGTYGTARPDTGNRFPATVWDLDTWDNYLIGCADSDGRILQWQLDTGVKAAAVSGAPTSCVGTFVTAQRTLVALGAGGAARKVQWSDVENNTVWTPTSTNKAGDFELQTVGTLLAGRRLSDISSFILTTVDAHVMTYIGGTLVYSFDLAGPSCGGYSRGCVQVVGQRAAWWGPGGFWLFDGALRPLDCDVMEYVRTNLNTAQASKITSFHNSKYGEVWWFYPSSSSTENDSYVYWDYRNNTWSIGLLERTCAVEQDVFTYPIAFDADGQGYEHEVGSSYDSVDPFVQYGPVELGVGDNVMRVNGIIPDENTQGVTSVTFYTRFYPTASQSSVTETSLNSSGKTDLSFTARQVDLKVLFSADAAARWGTPRLIVSQAGRR